MTFGLLSNLAWLRKLPYNLFFSENFIYSLGSCAQNVVVVSDVSMKSCSVIEMQLMASLCSAGMFRFFQNREHLY